MLINVQMLPNVLMIDRKMWFGPIRAKTAYRAIRRRAFRGVMHDLSRSTGERVTTTP